MKTAMNQAYANQVLNFLLGIANELALRVGENEILLLESGVIVGGINKTTITHVKPSITGGIKTYQDVYQAWGLLCLPSRSGDAHGGCEEYPLGTCRTVAEALGVLVGQYLGTAITHHGVESVFGGSQ